MLEDPASHDVARWGKDADIFVVVEVKLELTLASYKNHILTTLE